MKLGEILIKEGKITPEELDEALNSQVFFGGRLGTNLIEMGCLEEDDAARILSKVTGVAPVEHEKLENLSPEVIQSISPEMAQKYRIIPVDVSNKRLHLAMADPTDLMAIDEIAFATGYIIIPLIASELTISRYLKVYYKVQEEKMTLRVAGASRKRRLAGSEDGRNPPVAAAVPEDIDPFPPLDDGDEHFRDIMEQSSTTLAEVPASESIEECEQDISPAEKLCAQLVKAEDRDDVASILLQFAGIHYSKAALLVVKKDLLEGWSAVVAQKTVGGFGEITIPVETSPVMAHVIDSRVRYEGPIPDAVGDNRLLECLGGRTSDAVVIIPLHLQARVVALLYLAGDSEETALPDILKFASKAAMALEILILKNKILMT